MSSDEEEDMVFVPNGHVGPTLYCVGGAASGGGNAAGGGQDTQEDVRDKECLKAMEFEERQYSMRQPEGSTLHGAGGAESCGGNSAGGSQDT